MERVLGLGGVMFKARDPNGLAAWYAATLGVAVAPGQTYAVFESAAAGEATAWGTLPAGDGPPGTATVNYRVRNLDAMLAQLRAAGAAVEDRIDDTDYGRFGYAADPEGNRFELWEPKPVGGTEPAGPG